MIKKLIVALVLLIAADFAFNEGAYFHAATARLKHWGAASGDAASHSIFAQ